MNARAAVTVLRPREEVERLWRDPAYRPSAAGGSALPVRFVDAPGDRGTEIHVELPSQGSGGPVGEALARLRGTGALAQVKNELRRFKQQVETGEIPRSDSVPEGEQVGRKLHQRPAQPLSADERQKVGV